MDLKDLRTPQVLVDRARVHANIDRFQTMASASGLRLRPHAKTHKSPLIARWQLERGAVGICCAKLGEAEVFAAAGVNDIRLPYPLNPSNADRLAALTDRARISFIVDHPAVAQGWSDAMQRARRTVDVLVKVDVGFHRCGVDPSSPGALDLVQQVAGLPGLRLRGLLSHAGHGYAAQSDDELAETAARESTILTTLAEACRAHGVAIEEISVGATPTFRFSVGQPGLTEVRPGNYVYLDRTQVALGSGSVSDCALTVLATIVSKPAENRVILDAGAKALTTDQARGKNDPQGYGAVFTDLDATSPDDTWLIERLSEEHGVVRVLSGSTALEPGHRVRILPNHSCVVSNLVDEVTLVEGQRVLEALPVSARGRIQ